MSCGGCTIPASTLSAIWPNSSPSPAQPYIVPLPGRRNEAKAGMRHIALKIQRHLSLKITECLPLVIEFDDLENAQRFAASRTPTHAFALLARTNHPIDAFFHPSTANAFARPLAALVVNDLLLMLLQIRDQSRALEVLHRFLNLPQPIQVPT